MYLPLSLSLYIYIYVYVYIYIYIYICVWLSSLMRADSVLALLLAPLALFLLSRFREALRAAGCLPTDFPHVEAATALPLLM